MENGTNISKACMCTVDKDTVYNKISAITDQIKKCLPPNFIPTVGIITGTGLDTITSRITDSVTIPYQNIKGLKFSKVKGHSNMIIAGKIGAHNVVCFVGRCHFYEGYPMNVVTMPVRIMKLLGVKYLFVTNCCGGVNPSYNLGDVIVIKDHVNLVGMAGHNPLVGENDDRWGTRFPHLFNAYDFDLRMKIAKVCQKLDYPYREGVYCMNTGPTYQAKAEGRMLLRVGVDLVGMSTLPEVTVAAHCGIKVCAFSVIASAIKYDEFSYEILKDEGDDKTKNGGSSKKTNEYKVTKNLVSIDHESVVKSGKKGGEILGQIINDVIMSLD
ncbi:purine nucleoside phosphorylase 1-like [Gordionus sp. m RMFG-2023]|uniref:purine nucleoside phosphorylase 1-like n=1 Tax=Gordionus sp. m RMFG-2023 TaxID=3053472 RepID=UPI0031FE0321